MNVKPGPNRPQFRFQFDNHDHFFDDLPPLGMNYKKGRTLALPKEAQLRQKIAIAWLNVQSNRANLEALQRELAAVK